MSAFLPSATAGAAAGLPTPGQPTPGQPTLGSDRAKLHAAATQFEALLLRQMLAAARKTDFGGDLFDNGSGDGAMGTFRQMQDDNLADVVADTGSLGLSTMIEAQLARYLPRQG